MLATNAFPPLVRQLRPYIVPVYDYVLVTEPLSTAQLGAIGWRNRPGVGDSGDVPTRFGIRLEQARRRSGG